MSLKGIREVIAKFLISERPQALSISGKWGCGKTYFWQEAVKEASQNGWVGKYSYVSLFGINSLADLKSAVFDNAISTSHIIAGASSSTWAENVAEAMEVTSFGEMRRSGRHWFDWGRKNSSQLTPLLGAWGGVAKSLSFFAVKDYVICLDDLERKGNGLPLKEVFGLITLLKEQRNCRVAVILNRDEMREENSVIDAYREKVFDKEVSFEPTSKECASLIFTEDWECSREAVERVEILNINNIRTLQRIKSVVDELLPYVKKHGPSLVQRLVHSSVLLTWCYHEKGRDVPSYHLMKNMQLLSYTNGASGEKSEDQVLADRVASLYDYEGGDDFDWTVGDLIECGYVNEITVRVIEDCEDKFLRFKEFNHFIKEWKLFFYTFSDNQGALVSGLRERFMNLGKWVTPTRAMETIRFMRELNMDEVADDLISHWIKVAVYEPRNRLINLYENPLFDGAIDEKFKNEIIQAYEREFKNLEVGDIIKIFDNSSVRTRENMDKLSMASVDDYYIFFKSIVLDEKLEIYVKNCLNCEPSFIGDTRHEKIRDMASAALQKIAGENRLNMLRVTRFMPDTFSAI